MATIERFEDLDVWRTARKLTNRVYEHTRQEPFSKDFGLRDQIQRAAVSIMSNIADKASRQLFRLIQYLNSKPNASRVQERGVEYQINLDAPE